jgi:hypothetical protein
VPLGDNHGGEAVVGRRDTDWAHGNSIVTNILLLSAVWVVGAVFANQNAPALGKILDQQGLGNLTLHLAGKSKWSDPILTNSQEILAQILTVLKQKEMFSWKC